LASSTDLREIGMGGDQPYGSVPAENGKPGCQRLHRLVADRLLQLQILARGQNVIARAEGKVHDVGLALEIRKVGRMARGIKLLPVTK